MTKKGVAQITSEVYSLLSDLEADDRQRVIAATMALFGESVPKSSRKNDKNDEGLEEDDVANIGKKAKLWFKQNSLSLDDLQEIFHFDPSGSVEIIAAELPGSNKKEKTASAYLICGIRSLLQTDDTKFDNQDAVELCQHIGCYDKNNHSANRKALGNRITGSIKDGFTLPAPGLKAAADVIKSSK